MMLGVAISVVLSVRSDKEELKAAVVTSMASILLMNTFCRKGDPTLTVNPDGIGLTLLFLASMLTVLIVQRIRRRKEGK
jgi:hypothetical protein